MPHQPDYTLECSLFACRCHSRLRPDRARELSRLEIVHRMPRTLDQMAREDRTAWIHYAMRVADSLGLWFVPDVHLSDSHYCRGTMAQLQQAGPGPWDVTPGDDSAS